VEIIGGITSLQVINYKLQATNYRLQAYKIQPYKLQSYKLQVPNLSLNLQMTN
jgi:hypothetical protein